MTIIRKRVISFACCLVLTQALPLKARHASLTDVENQEMLAMVTNVNHGTLAYRATVTQKMVEEASFYVDRLHLPTPHPIRITDIPGLQYPCIGIPLPWFSLLHEASPPHWPVSRFGPNIYNPSIPREQRLHALKIGLNGIFETTNFQFIFVSGKLREIMRLSSPQVERYARNLDELVGKPSLIDTNGAYQLATQWLAAADMNMTALNQQKCVVHQLSYLPLRATNAVVLPLYYVDYDNIHHAASGNLNSLENTLVSVEILGTTKELQDLLINDLSLSRRPVLLITNAIELIRTPNLTIEHSETAVKVKTNSFSRYLPLSIGFRPSKE